MGLRVFPEPDWIVVTLFHALNALTGILVIGCKIAAYFSPESTLGIKTVELSDVIPIRLIFYASIKSDSQSILESNGHQRLYFHQKRAISRLTDRSALITSHEAII
ncbi:hypothetical protein PATY110618_13875 [Paenibacillus typhae]|uniref:Uncharacterized protein n=1 Tax=Paenibacillus typhae TaxID=1174501 RepID=A0A1G8ULV0_9BACL|nr:hypothetical protein SAMN05216192_11934 [Paenibacillus typhae]